MENFLSRKKWLKNAPHRCCKSQVLETLPLNLPTTDLLFPAFGIRRRTTNKYRQRIYQDPIKHAEHKAKERLRKMRAKLMKQQN